MDDRPGMDLFGCDQRKTLAQVKPQLVTENADRPGTRTVGFLRSFFKDQSHKIVVLLHKMADFFSLLKATKPFETVLVISI